MKVRLTVEETVRYQTEVVIEQPETMSDEELNNILDRVERQCRHDSGPDIAFVLEKEYGIKIHKVSSGFPDNPCDSELEIIDVSNIDE